MRAEAAAFALAVYLLATVGFGSASQAAVPDSLGAPVDTLAAPAPPKPVRPSTAPT